MNTQNSQNIKMSENIIIVDADYIDKVAFNLIVNFERMLNRKIPAADFSQWIVDVALDGRLKPGNHETQVVLLHDKNKATLENFVPSDFQRELDKQAFADEKLGDVLRIALSHDEVHRIMLVPNAEEGNICSVIRNTVKDVDDEHKHITLFAMMPMEGGNFKQQILGYSLMNAMGITSQEIDKSIR